MLLSPNSLLKGYRSSREVDISQYKNYQLSITRLKIYSDWGYNPLVHYIPYLSNLWKVVWFGLLTFLRIVALWLYLQRHLICLMIILVSSKHLLTRLRTKISLTCVGHLNYKQSHLAGAGDFRHSCKLLPRWLVFSNNSIQIVFPKNLCLKNYENYKTCRVIVEGV